MAIKHHYRPRILRGFPIICRNSRPSSDACKSMNWRANFPEIPPRNVSRKDHQRYSPRTLLRDMAQKQVWASRDPHTRNWQLASCTWT